MSVLVTFCCKDRQRVFEDGRKARLAEQAMMMQREDGLYWLYVYCVMPDHIHIYLRTRGVRHLSRIVARLKFDIMRLVGRLQWQRGYFEKIIRGCVAPSEVARYILLNPVRAGLVTRAEDYPFMGVVDRYE